MAQIVQVAPATHSWSALALFGWHAPTACYTLHFFDSAGANPPRRVEGQLSGATLELYQPTPFGQLRYRYARAAPDHLSYDLASEAAESNWQPVISGSYLFHE